MDAIPFEIGRTYDRQRDIHAPFKGQEQGGISTPGVYPFVFLFTGETGEQYGYKDDWTSDGVFLYTGEGQIGDMEFIRGNKAIRDHATNGKDLLLFEALGKGRGIRYNGSFACASWEKRPRADKLGNPRLVIVFHLVPTEDISEEVQVDPTATLDELRQRAFNASRDVAEGSTREARQSYYKRSAAVKACVLARAAGICEACKRPAPFRRLDQSYYLEPHHTRRVSDGGPDDPRWVAGICPNCHREIHHGAAGKELNDRLELYLREIE